jgi:hypothetical protein
MENFENISSSSSTYGISNLTTFSQTHSGATVPLKEKSV